VEAGVEAGHSRNSDFHGGKQDGVGFYQLRQRHGMRCSAAVAFLHPALGRPNPKIVTDALATRILFDGARASGIEILRHGELQEIAAETEVVLLPARTIRRNSSCFPGSARPPTSPR
jgi:choline dehydrogenase